MTWVNEIMEVINTIGLKNCFGICLILLFFVIIYGIYRFLKSDIPWDFIAKKLSDKNAERHDINEMDGAALRMSVNPQISNILVKLMMETDSDRAGILEVHNGKENPSGLPFLYVDMTYEETKANIPNVSDECENLSLTKYQMSNYMYEHRFFIGTVTALKEIDKRLYVRLVENDVKYIGIIMIMTDRELGFLEVLYNDKPSISKDEIHAKLGDAVQKVSKLLDYKNRGNANT